MKGYLDAKELESYKKEDLQELAKQLGVDAEGTKKEIATRCAAVEVDIPDESELTEEDKPCTLHLCLLPLCGALSLLPLCLYALSLSMS